MIATLAALYAVSAVAYARLPASTVNPGFIAFLLPTAALTIYVLMRLLAARDPAYRGHETSSRAYDAIVFRVVLFIGALHGAVLLGLLGRGFISRWGPVVPRLAPALLGVALMAIGNLLPRTRPNSAIGIRTKETLRSRDAWLKVNRRAGYVAVALGFAILMTALFVPPGPQVAGVVGGVGIAALVTLVAWTWKDAHGRHERA